MRIKSENPQGANLGAGADGRRGRSSTPSIAEIGPTVKPSYIRAGRRRDPGFVKVYCELLRCYAPLIGLDGIGYWTFLADYRHDGHLAEELLDRAWLGRRAIIELTPIGGTHRVRRLNDALVNAGLLDIDRAGDLFTDEELASLRRRGCYLQPDSNVHTIHEPLAFAQFAELNFDGPCRTCGYRAQCDAYAARRNAQLGTEPQDPGAETAPHQDRTPRPNNQQHGCCLAGKLWSEPDEGGDPGQQPRR